MSYGKTVLKQPWLCSQNSICGPGICIAILGEDATYAAYAHVRNGLLALELRKLNRGVRNNMEAETVLVETGRQEVVAEEIGNVSG